MTITSQDYLNHRLMSFTPDVVDPWVVVGTTTIDGTWSQVDEMLGFTNLVDDDVFFLGGRHVRPREHVAESYAAKTGGVKVVVCDIVRRQSEIDAEEAAQRANIPEVLRRLRASGYNISDRATCPECGPHGNRGEVLLASSWAKCTTCAGGKTGDLWGEVKTPGPATAQEALSSALIAEGASSEVAQAGVRAFVGALNKPPPSFMDARREALAAQHGQVYSEGERVVDRWGRTGVVVPADESWPKSVRVRMDAGWTGIFSLREIAGKADP